jgi:hypothetical protein
MDYQWPEKRNLSMSFLRHNGFKKCQRAAKKQPFELTFLSAVKLSLAGCSPAEPTSVLLDITNCSRFFETQINLENKHQLFCPLEQNIYKLPTILSITPKFFIEEIEKPPKKPSEYSKQAFEEYRKVFKKEVRDKM